MMCKELLFQEASTIDVLAIILLFIVLPLLCWIGAHISCYIARKTNKPVCACWDCKKPCELWKYKKE